MPIVLITAWQMLVDRRAAPQGETVLVSLPAQAWAARHPDRQAVGPRRRHRDGPSPTRSWRGRALGADDVINHAREESSPPSEAHESPRRRRRRRALGRRDLSEVRSSACAKGGRIVTCGATDGLSRS